MTANEPTLRDVLNEVAELRKELAQFEQVQEQSQKWQDRTWDVVKWVGGISAGLSISAAIALVGLVIRFAITQQ